MNETPKTRLWGEWKVVSWKSGNIVVLQNDEPNKPWISVYPDPLPSEYDQERNRMEMCNQIASWMNGGKRPVWLDDFERQRYDYLMSLTGAEIFSTGPIIQQKSNKSIYTFDDSKDSKKLRKILLDVLVAKN